MKNSILEKHEQLEDKLKALANENKKAIGQQQAFKKVDEQLLQKQAQIQELMDKLLSDEMKQMMQDMQQMLEKMQDKKAINDDIEELKLDNQDMEKELNRTLELYKQMEFEQKLQGNIQKIDALKEKQEALSKQTKEAKKEALEALKKEQEALNKETEALAESLKEMEELNESLEFSNELPKQIEEQGQEIQKKQKEASQALEQDQQQKSSEKQKEAANQMQELSNQMQAAMQQMQQEAAVENMNDMRQLLENLVDLSFNQEALMQQISSTSVKDPAYNGLVQAQYTLKDDAKLIEDSLFALSKRVPEISAKVNKELNVLNNMLTQSIKLLANRRQRQAFAKQQSAMTNANNLALLFDEIIQQMQAQMQAQQSGNGSCSKPGGKGSKPSAGAMRKMQQALNKQMQQLKKELAEGGKQQGGGTQGNKAGTSKKLAKMAAEQEALRRMLQEAQNELGQQSGGKAGQKIKELQDLMEQTETDIVNKRITQQTINRQEKILSKLLESEKAERERDKDQKRESITAKNETERNLNTFFKYRKKEKDAVIELLKYQSPQLNSFYNQKVNRYLNLIE